MYGTVKAALNRLTKSLAAELYNDGIAVNAAAPSNPVATPGAGTLDLAKTDTEDIELITQTALTLCTSDPKTLTGRIAHTQPFLREIVGWFDALRTKFMTENARFRSTSVFSAIYPGELVGELRFRRFPKPQQVLRREYVRRSLPVLEQQPRQRHLVNLGGPVGQSEHE